MHFLMSITSSIAHIKHRYFRCIRDVESKYDIGVYLRRNGVTNDPLLVEVYNPLTQIQLRSFQ